MLDLMKGSPKVHATPIFTGNSETDNRDFLAEQRSMSKILPGFVESQLELKQIHVIERAPEGQQKPLTAQPNGKFIVAKNQK